MYVQSTYVPSRIPLGVEWIVSRLDTSRTVLLHFRRLRQADFVDAALGFVSVAAAAFVVCVEEEKEEKESTPLKQNEWTFCSWYGRWPAVLLFPLVFAAKFPVRIVPLLLYSRGDFLLFWSMTMSIL